MHPPFSFRLAEKKTGRARSKRKGAGCQTLRLPRKVWQGRGSCESDRRGSIAPSSLRRTPALERPWNRIDGAADNWGAKLHLPLLLFPRLPLYPQGVRRIRKAAELPTAAQLLGAAPGGLMQTPCWILGVDGRSAHRPDEQCRVSYFIVGADSISARCPGTHRTSGGTQLLAIPTATAPAARSKAERAGIEIRRFSFPPRPSAAPSNAGAQFFAEPLLSQGRRGCRHPPDRFARPSYFGK